MKWDLKRIFAFPKVNNLTGFSVAQCKRQFLDDMSYTWVITVVSVYMCHDITIFLRTQEAEVCIQEKFKLLVNLWLGQKGQP